MIILDINEEQNMLEATIKGSSFYSDLNCIKRIEGAIFNKENKTWLLPRTMQVINKLKNQTTVLYKQDEYTLAGIAPPSITTAVDIIKQNNSTSLTQLINEYNLDKMKVNLFDFQKLGVIAATYMLLNYGGFLIGDTMGLGKTIQALGVVHALKKLNKANKIIISTPKNVKYQWGDEIEKFTDMSYVVVDGYNREKRLSCFEKDVDIYIINHDQLINDDFEYLLKIKPDIFVVDEIHYFKTHTTKRTRALKKIGELTKYRLGLTGTPMQNHPSDVHSIFEFLIPDLLGPWNEFKKRYIYYSYDYGYPQEEGYQNLFELKQRISPFMIRRLTRDVRDDLPEVHTKTHYVEMSPIQQYLHDLVQEYIEETKEEVRALKNKISKLHGKAKKNAEKEMEGLDGRIMGYMNIQMEISNDLELLKVSDSHWVRKLVEDIDIPKSNKLEKTLKLVETILNYNKDFKIVIFSQFATMIKKIKDEIEKRGLSKEVAIIYGDLTEKQRNEEKNKFVNNPECRVICNSDAAAEGINLQVASHLINFDLPWNPAVLEQRNGRINRIGSPWKNVFISNIISIGSIDENIEKTISKKRSTFNLIVENTDQQQEALKEFITEII